MSKNVMHAWCPQIQGGKQPVCVLVYQSIIASVSWTDYRSYIKPKERLYSVTNCATMFSASCSREM